MHNLRCLHLKNIFHGPKPVVSSSLWLRWAPDNVSDRHVSLVMHFIVTGRVLHTYGWLIIRTIPAAAWRSNRLRQTVHMRKVVGHVDRTRVHQRVSQLAQTLTTLSAPPKLPPARRFLCSLGRSYWAEQQKGNVTPSERQLILWDADLPLAPRLRLRL